MISRLTAYLSVSLVLAGVLPAQQPAASALPPVHFFSSSPLTERNEQIVYALIGIHGVRGSAEGYFRLMTAAAVKAGKGNHTLVIAPKFYETAELGDKVATTPYLSWRRGWRYGDESVPTAAVPACYSSFAVIDLMVRHLAKRALFPNLQTIIIAGHSAGGQFVARYAAGNVVEADIAPMRIRLRYAISSPSSFLYFTSERPVEGTPGGFAIPDVPQREYNRYPYGMDNLNAYMQQLGVEGMRTRYSAREVTYLVGELDNDPKANNGLDLGKAALWQGPNRLERASAYWRHVQEQFGQNIRATQAFQVIKNTGHSGYRIFVTPEGLAALFDPEKLRVGFAAQ